MTVSAELEISRAMIVTLQRELRDTLRELEDERRINGSLRSKLAITQNRLEMALS